MRRRYRIATVGTIAAMAIAVMSSSVGAATPGNFSASADGGFVSLSALNLVDLAGGGSTASATAPGGGGTATDNASGTGLCLALGQGPASTDNPCPTTGSASTSDVLNTTSTASATSAAGGPASDTPADKCLVPPISIPPLVQLSVACGHASAQEDSVGNPTANGTGQLANVQVGLGVGSLGALPLLGNGPLCASGNTSSVGQQAAGSSSTAPSTGLLGSLLGTVNTILGSAGQAPLSSSTSGSSGPLSSICGVLSGLLGELPVVGPLVSSLDNISAANTSLLNITVGQGTSSVTNSVASAASGSGTTAVNVGDDLVTSKATTEAVEINILGMLDIKVLPNTATITVDTTTGYVVSADAPAPGLLSVQQGSGLPTIIALPELESILNQVLSALNIGGLINPQQTVIVGSSTSGVGTTSGTAAVADLKIDLLNGLLILNLGDAHVAASSSVAPAVVSPVVTSPAVTPPSVPVVTQAAIAPATPAAIVPNVTSVHTGEFWSGPLPIVLIAGMGLAGIVLIARRRMFSVARALMPFARHAAHGSAGGLPPGPASGTSSVPPPVSGPARRQPLP